MYWFQINYYNTCNIVKKYMPYIIFKTIIYQLNDYVLSK